MKKKKNNESNDFFSAVETLSTDGPTVVAHTNEFSTYVPLLYTRSNFLFSFSFIFFFARFLVTSCKQIFCIYWLVLDTSYTHAACTYRRTYQVFDGGFSHFFMCSFFRSLSWMLSASVRSLLLTLTGTSSVQTHNIWSSAADEFEQRKKKQENKIETKSWDIEGNGNGSTGTKRRKCLTIKLLNARSRVIDTWRKCGKGQSMQETEKIKKFDAGTYGMRGESKYERHAHTHMHACNDQSTIE